MNKSLKHTDMQTSKKKTDAKPPPTQIDHATLSLPSLKPIMNMFNQAEVCQSVSLMNLLRVENSRMIFDFSSYNPASSNSPGTTDMARELMMKNTVVFSKQHKLDKYINTYINRQVLFTSKSVPEPLFLDQTIEAEFSSEQTQVRERLLFETNNLELNEVVIRHSVKQE